MVDKNELFKESKNRKAVYIASSANIMAVKLVAGEVAVSLKSGGVAPGINNAVPKEDFYKAGWLGIMESPGAKTTPEETVATEALEAKMLAGLKDWEKENGITEGQNGFVFIDKPTFDVFYKQTTNGIIWPLIHSMAEKVDPDGDLNSHTPVNELYAKTLFDQILGDINDVDKPEITSFEDVVVWAHDYHVFQVPGMLTDLIKEHNQNLENLGEETLGEPNIAFFHHETWPNLTPELKEENSPEDDKVYMNPEKGMKDAFKTILTNLIQADSLGFHTQSDADNFVETVKNFGVETNLEALKAKTLVNPIGIPKDRLKTEFLDRVPVLKQGLDNYSGVRTSPFFKALERQKDKLYEEITEINANLNDPFSTDEERAVSEEQSKKFEDGKIVASLDKIVKGGASLHDYQTVTTGAYFNPEKIHMASVSRFDYTKGIKEFLDAYKDFLVDEQSTNPESNPGDLYQFNLVTGAGRSSPIKEYQKYTDTVLNQIKAINDDFPRAVFHYPSGINNSELPIFNAMNDLEVAASIKDGYILSVGEMIHARNEVLKHPDLETLLPQHRATGTIISRGAGITEDLGGADRVSTIPALSIVEPTPAALLLALREQIHNIKELRNLKLEDERFKTDLQSALEESELDGHYNIIGRNSESYQKYIDNLSSRVNIIKARLQRSTELQSTNSSGIGAMAGLTTNADDEFGKTAFARVSDDIAGKRDSLRSSPSRPSPSLSRTLSRAESSTPKAPKS